MFLSLSPAIWHYTCNVSDAEHRLSSLSQENRTGIHKRQLRGGNATWMEEGRPPEWRWGCVGGSLPPKRTHWRSFITQHGFTVCSRERLVWLTDRHQLYVLLVQELQSHRHVLQLHLAEGGPLVVLSEHLFLGQHLQEPDEPQPVAEVRLQVADPLVDAFQVLVTPSGKGVLLDLLPRRILGQVLLRGGHFCVLVRGESVGSGRGALVEPGVWTTHFYGLDSLLVRWLFSGWSLLNFDLPLPLALSLFLSLVCVKENRKRKNWENMSDSLIAWRYSLQGE